MKTPKKIYVVLLLFLSCSFSAQTWTWNSALTNTNSAYKLERDRYQDIYMYGPQGVTKMKPNGQVIWQSDFPGLYISGLTIGNYGYVYIVGSFEDTVFFGANTLIPKGYSDGFIASITNNGAADWIHQVGGTSDDELADICIQNNQLYVCGTGRGDWTMGGTTFPGAGPGGGLSDIVVCTFSQNGAFGTLKRSVPVGIGGPDFYYDGCGASEILAGQNGKVYVLAGISGPIQIDTFHIQSQFSSYVLELDQNLNLKKTILAESDLKSGAYQMHLDSYGNIIYVFSGGDQYGDYWCSINKIQNMDSVSTLFKQSGSIYNNSGWWTFENISLDSCDNIVLNGRGFLDSPNPSFYVHSLLDPKGNVQWVKIDTLQSSYVLPWSLISVSRTLAFECGSLSGTVTLNSSMVQTGNDYLPFAASFNPISSLSYLTCDANLLSVRSNSSIEPLRIFPNPFSDHININATSPGLVRVYDMKGLLILEKQVQPDQRLDLVGINSGVYLVELHQEESRTCAKAVCVRE